MAPCSRRQFNPESCRSSDSKCFLCEDKKLLDLPVNQLRCCRFVLCAAHAPEPGFAEGGATKEQVSTAMVPELMVLQVTNHAWEQWLCMWSEPWGLL